MTRTNARALLAWVAVAVMALSLALLVRPAAQAADAGPRDVAAEGTEAQVGEVDQTFAVESYAQVCARCHGLDGNGGEVPATGEPVPALRNNPDVTAAYLDLVMLTGRMPPAGDPFDNRTRELFYDDAERRAMVDYMTEAFDIPGEIPTVGVGNAALGLEVFARNCAHCHGNAGDGGTAGQRAFTPKVNDRPALAIIEAIRVGPFEMPAFSTDVISEREADSIVAYLEEVQAEEGTFLFGLVELNPVFASGFVILLAAALVGSLLYISGRPVPFEDLLREPLGAPPEADAEEDAEPADEAAVDTDEAVEDTDEAAHADRHPPPASGTGDAETDTGTGTGTGTDAADDPAPRTTDGDRDDA